MAKNKKTSALIMTLVVVIILSLITIFAFSFDSDKQVENDNAPSSPIKLDLIMIEPPHLGETGEIRVVTSYLGRMKDNMPLTTVQVFIPEGLELIDGELYWEGELRAEESFTLKVRPVKEGNWTIEAIARSPPSGETYYGGRDFIYLIVTKDDGSFISNKPFDEQKECPQGINCGIKV